MLAVRNLHVTLAVTYGRCYFFLNLPLKTLHLTQLCTSLLFWFICTFYIAVHNYMFTVTFSFDQSQKLS